jgi:hypothetical protein
MEPLQRGISLLSACRSLLKSGLWRRLLMPAALGLAAAALFVSEAQAAAGAPGAWSMTANMAAGRYDDTATVLPNGKVLVVGGYNYPPGALASAELYDSATRTWSTTGSMAVARDLHTATLLPNGKVLVAGGYSENPMFVSLASAELYDPATGAWSTTASMAVARRNHTATLLPNGKVLVAGGLGSSATDALTNAELYDPATGTWSTTANMAVSRSHHVATLLSNIGLSNGKVMVAGGANATGILDSAELYDPATATWSTTGGMTDFRSGHTATQLSNGKVLVAGGSTGSGNGYSAELYDPMAGTWSTTDRMAVGRVSPFTATLLPNGSVLIAGGWNSQDGRLASAELYNPATGTWSTTASMRTARQDHIAALLQNGQVLVAGGAGLDSNNACCVSLAGAELYDPAPTAAPAGLLRVASSPAVPTQISVDGDIADSWGLTWMKEPSGTHRVCFAHVDGWTEPPCQNVTVNNGATTTVTGNFTQRGQLRVLTSPAEPSQISVDGNPTDEYGMWTDIATGVHNVCWGAVAGWAPPACQNVTVNAGATTTVTGTFTACCGCLAQSGVGLLRVTTNPALPSQITIQQGLNKWIADHWGLSWLELSSAGSPYTVCFQRVIGWTEPACQTVTVSSGVTTTVTGNFARRGFLRVFTTAGSPGTVYVDGIPRNDWGIWTDIPVGLHSVCFGQAGGYSNTPPCQSASIAWGAETDITGTYS